ncbi:MAG: hypothetical protein HQM07_05915 [Zetaproteobacteria bacterium]|nr:hypothetical protein [Zetaproteobacteria bacterium]
MTYHEKAKELMGQIVDGQLNQDWEDENIRFIISLFAGLTHDDAKDSTALGLSKKEYKALQTAIYAATKRYESHIWDMYDRKADFDIGDVHVFLMLLYGADARIDDVSRAQSPSRYGAKGGVQAAENRRNARKKIQAKVKEIQGNNSGMRRGEWGQTIASITDTIWGEIKAAKENGEIWQGITPEELELSQVGRQTVYEVVK